MFDGARASSAAISGDLPSSLIAVPVLCGMLFVRMVDDGNLFFGLSGSQVCMRLI